MSRMQKLDQHGYVGYSYLLSVPIWLPLGLEAMLKRSAMLKG